jgi:hypothetical protein
VNPLSEFAVERVGPGAHLVFEHLGASLGLGEITGFVWEWFAFDNDADRLTPLGVPKTSDVARIRVPSHAASFLMVRIRSLGQEPAWGRAVDVYLRNADVPALVGIEREESDASL